MTTILTDDQRHHLSEAAIILQNLAGTQQDENERTHLENVCSLVFETRNKYQMPDPPTIHNSDGFAFKAGPHDDVPLLVKHLVTAKRYASDDPIDLEPAVFTIAVLNNKFDGETIYGNTCGVDWQCKSVATMQIGDWRFIDMELDFA